MYFVKLFILKYMTVMLKLLLYLKYSVLNAMFFFTFYIPWIKVIIAPVPTILPILKHIPMVHVPPLAPE